MKLKVTVNQIPYEVEVEVDQTPAGLPPVYIGGGPGGASAPAAVHAAESMVTAPLAGSVRKILVAAGDSVTAGQVVAILEAMKMETEITAPKAGKVAKVLVEVGAAVQGGDPIIDIEV